MATADFYVRCGVCALAFVLVSLLFIPLCLLTWGSERSSRAYLRIISRVAAPLLKVKVRLHHRERLAHQPCIYVVNHQSLVEVILLGAAYPRRTIAIAKREVASIPLFGLLYRATGNILIDRSDHAGAVAGLDKAVATLQRRGLSIWIFPEGTRNRTDEPLGAFKKGAFHMALAAQVPVVPLVLTPLRRHFDPAARRIVPGVLDISVLEPIVPGKDEDAAALCHRVRSSMLDELAALGSAQAA